MKKYLGLLAAALLCCSCAHYTKLPSTQPIKAAVTKAQHSTERVVVHVSKAQQQVTQAQAHAKNAQAKIKTLEKVVAKQQEALTLTQGIQTEVDALTTELTDTQTALAGAQTELQNTQAQLKEAVTKADSIQRELDAKQRILDRAVQTEKKYHQLKWGVCALAAGLVGLIMFQFAKFLLPLGWFGIAAMAAPPMLVFGYLFYKL